MINIGVIGCGHWGPNHIRIFTQLNDSHVPICSDLDKGRLDSIKGMYPQVEVTKDFNVILKDSTIDAVCISTPTNTHYELAKKALENDKHVLCEKPLAMSEGECLELKALAEQKGKILMVGHVFLFNSGIVWLRDFLKSGELGRIFYAYSIRTNLGPFRYDVNALWDLAPHDISILNFLFGQPPGNVSARGQKYLNDSQEDLAFATYEYHDNIIANVHVSWLDPKKVRQLTIVGDKKMLVWDDLDNLGPIKLYDKHVEKTSTYYSTYGEFQLLSKEGSITIPKIGFSEPLKGQGEYFIDCVKNNKAPDMVDARKAADVVKTLQATQDSMAQQGHLVKIL